MTAKRKLNNKSGDNKKRQKSKRGFQNEKMAQEMESSMSGGEMEQQTEDIKTIRQLLENLVTVSYDQERLAKDIGATLLLHPVRRFG